MAASTSEIIAGPSAAAAPASRARVLSGFAVIYVVWGSTFLAIAYADQSLPPVLTTGVRYAVAGVLLCGWAWVAGAARWPSGRQWWSAAVAGLDRHAAIGAAVLTLAAILWAAGSLYTRQADLPSAATLSMGLQMLAGGVMCVVVGLTLGEGATLDLARVSRASWIAFAYLTIAGCLAAFTTYLWLLRVSTPSRVATHAYVNPIIAVLLGWVAGEPLTGRTVLAAGLIVGAVVLITTRGGEDVPSARHPSLATEPT